MVAWASLSSLSVADNISPFFPFLLPLFALTLLLLLFHHCSSASRGKKENEEKEKKGKRSKMIKSAGILIYRRNAGQIEYLLLQDSVRPAHWTPPKGHLDKGEDEWTAAKREVKEESGIDESQLEVDTDFKHEMQYAVNGKPKKCTYWLAAVKKIGQKVRISSEHQQYKWVELRPAIALADYEGIKEMLREADAYLSSTNRQ